MKRIFNIILFALFGTSFVQAQVGKTFEFTYEGQTLKYVVADGNEAMVSNQKSAKISGDVKIPEKVKFKGKKYTVTSIGVSAFANCTRLTSVTIPNSVTTIGEDAFRECKGLINVTIPNSVTTIGEYAFSDCTGLTSVTIPNSVTTIGVGAFAYCENLKSINVAKDNSHYCSENGVLFDITKKRLIQCPGGIKGNYAIPNGVTSIEEFAFSHCKGLTSVTIPNSVTKIGDGAFRGCASLTSVTIPNSVTSIGVYAFYGCTSLTSVAIPNSVTKIDFEAFRGCAGLTSVTIPNSVTTIGNVAFWGCTGLTILTIENATPPVVEGFTFEKVSENITIYVPAESVEKYKTARVWSEYADKIKAIER